MRLNFLSQLIRLFLILFAIVAPARTPQQSTSAPSAPSRADILRGEYGPWRANNDLLSYDLDIRIDPEKKFVSGKNTIRFRMLKDDSRIQLDLFDNLKIDRIELVGKEHSAKGKAQETKDRTSKAQDQRPKTSLKYKRD